jgi:hypothetical protein
MVKVRHSRIPWSLFPVCLILLVAFPVVGYAKTVTLAWGAPATGTVDGYRVFYHLAGQSYNYSQPAWQGTTTTCTLSNLQDVTTYFVARAYNSFGESADSNEVTYQPATSSPVISLNTSFLSASCTQGSNATSQSFQVSNSGGGTLSYTISDNVSWLSCSPTSGTSTGASNTVTVSYATSGLAAGNYSASITVTDSAAANSPQTITVNLTVSSAGTPGQIGSINPSASADDGAMWYDSGWRFNNSYTLTGWGKFNGYREWAFVRFTIPTAIASTATITSATLELWGSSHVECDDYYVYVTESSDAPAPATASDRPSIDGGGTTTYPTSEGGTGSIHAASTFVSGQYNQISITSLIQHLVTTYGLAPGSHVVVWLAGATAEPTTAEDTAYANDYTSALPRLTIQVQTGGGGTTGNNFSNDSACKAVYNFESGKPTTDSKGSYTLTNTGSVTANTTYYEQGSASGDFNGSSKYETIADASLTGFPLASGDSNKVISACFWMRTGSAFGSDEWRNVFNKWNGGSNKRTIAVSLHNNSGTVRVEAAFGGNRGASAELVHHASNLSASTWYHVTVTYNDSGKSWAIRIRNTSGATVGSDATGTLSSLDTIALNDAPLWIGAAQDGSEWWNGQIDELVFFNDIVSDTEATTIAKGEYGATGVSNSQRTIQASQNVVASNLAPQKPVITSPYTGQVECDPLLHVRTAPFSDPDSGDSHSKSRWQISSEADFSSLVLDVTSTTWLTEFPVPHSVLDRAATYFVRVQFYDSVSEASEWSDAVEFTTVSAIVDNNDNGIPDTREVDDTVDLNGDGVTDNDQPELIKSVRAAVGDNIAVGVCKRSNSIVAIEALDTIHPSLIPDKTNRPSNLIYGLVTYRLRVNAPGSKATVTLYFSSDISHAQGYYVYDTVNGWQDYTQHGILNADGRSVTLELQDGGFGDSDGVANGVIVDPGGVVAIASGNTSTGDSSGGSGGGGGSCFIATAQSQSAGQQWDLTLISGILMCLALSGYLTRIRKKG